METEKKQSFVASSASDIRSILLGDEAKKLPIEPFEIPSLKLKFYIKGLSSAQRSKFEASFTRANGKRDAQNAYARLLVRCICSDEQGTRVFGDDDALELGGVRADMMASMYDVAQRLSGYSKEDLDELGKSSETAEA